MLAKIGHHESVAQVGPEKIEHQPHLALANIGEQGGTMVEV